MHYGPVIPTSNLVLCIDAMNPKSYPGSGTTVTDLSSSGNDCTLVNGPTYNAAGYFDLDGTDDYIQLGSTQILAKTGSTILIWFYKDADANYGLFTFNTNSYDDHVQTNTDSFFGESGSNCNYVSVSNSNATGGGDINATTWYHFALVLSEDGSGNNLATMYVNGNGYTRPQNGNNGYGLVACSVNSDEVVEDMSVNYIGSSTHYAGSLNGRISQVMIYDTALTSTQVNQIYTSTRERFT